MLATLFLSLFSLVSSLTCMDDNGNPIDSWVGLKKPKSTDYIYYDSETAFATSQHSMNDTDSGALAYTTKQLWSPDLDSYVIYNDEPPGQEGYNFSYGHTKGFFAFGTDGNGFYVAHSVPLFPRGPGAADRYLAFEQNAWEYGQDILCLSVSAEILDGLSKKFLLNRPEVYDSKVSEKAVQLYPNIAALASGQYSAEAVCDFGNFQTSGGLSFRQFAKSTEWNNELYSQCISPQLQTDLWVESWIRGSEEPPYCPSGGSGYQVLDIKAVDFGADGAWSEYNDHSKWAIGLEGNWVCFGAINRMSTQYKRGGGASCFQDKTLYSILRAAVSYTTNCGEKLRAAQPLLRGRTAVK